MREGRTIGVLLWALPILFTLHTIFHICPSRVTCRVTDTSSLRRHVENLVLLRLLLYIDMQMLRSKILKAA